MQLKKYKLGELIDVRRGASLSGEYYATEGELMRLTLGHFDYQGGGFKDNTSKNDLYFTRPVKPEFILSEGDIITPLTEQTPGWEYSHDPGIGKIHSKSGCGIGYT